MLMQLTQLGIDQSFMTWNSLTMEVTALPPCPPPNPSHKSEASGVLRVRKITEIVLMCMPETKHIVLHMFLLR